MWFPTKELLVFPALRAPGKTHDNSFPAFVRGFETSHASQDAKGWHFPSLSSLVFSSLSLGLWQRKKENKERYSSLRKDYLSNGYRFIPLIGSYKETTRDPETGEESGRMRVIEDTIFVPDRPYKEGAPDLFEFTKSIAKKYDQDLSNAKFDNFSPAIILEAIFATGRPVAFETKGTVLLALGFTSNT